MVQNLTDFVKTFVEKGAKQSFPNIYIVDKETGPYRKIQDALDIAEPNSLVKISQGFYQQNLIITKPVRLEPKIIQERSQKIGVILLVESGIGIHIKLGDQTQQCKILGIKVSHSGNSDSNIKKELMEHQHIIDIFGTKTNQFQQLDHQYVNRVSFNKVDNMVIYIQQGKLIIQSCLLSLNYLVKSCNSIIPGICVERQGFLKMDNSQIKGHPTKETVGIVSKLGVVQVENSVISNHKEGGILTWGIGGNNSCLIKNLIENNSLGIHMVGQDFKMKIYSNTICNNKIGIKVGLASQPEISRNSISDNYDGIQVNSSFPLIYLNKIQNQKNNGIVCKTYKRFYCKAEIKKNISIVGSKANGILIEGQNNRTKVIQNYIIGFNHEAGIKVTKEASPLISLNKIYKNFKEGILVTENSAACVEKNNISHNVECNVAMGGVNSHHTILVENNISDSPGPGIIMVDSGRCIVTRNDIQKNSDGVIMRNSHSCLSRNYISKNLNNGITCQKQSKPTVVQNLVSMNNSIGLFLRDFSMGVLRSNTIVSNQVEVGLQKDDQTEKKDIPHVNTIQGQVYLPQKLACSLI